VIDDEAAPESADRLRARVLLNGWVPVIAFANGRAAPPTSEQPQVTLHHWRIVLVSSVAAGSELRLTGYLAPEGPTVRVTTAVVRLDAAARLAITRSGRRYLLPGPPCEDGERRLVLTARLALVGLHVEEDMSDGFWRMAAPAGDSR
jgi:hypothetical protein